MNYYEHHIGDYDANTSHLSWAEDMAYTRLIRWYYRKEKPIPSDLSEACRQIRAVSREQKAAVESVLKEFFELRDDGWHKDRCDELLADYHAGEPEREARKANEDARLKRHREERAELFKTLTLAGHHAAWNIGIKELREFVKKLSAPADAPLPATAPATPATATQKPVPTNHSPLPTSQQPTIDGSTFSSEQSPDGAKVAEVSPKPRKHHGTEDDHKAAHWMLDRIREADATAKEPKWDAWANEIRLMREQDGRAHREMCSLFGWAQRDPFWRANVLSPSKLREKWTQLAANRERAPIGTTGRPGAPMSDEARTAANEKSDEEAKRLLFGNAANDSMTNTGNVIDA